MDTERQETNEKTRQTPRDKNLLFRWRWSAFRWAPVLILLFAATMKARQNVSGFNVSSEYLDSPIFVNAIIIFEFLFAFWLSLNFYERQSRFASVLLFSVFACVSFTKALAGEQTCGCFGNLTVPPVLTACLDVVVAFLSARSLPSESSNKPRSSSFIILRIGCLGVVFLLAAGTAFSSNESKTIVPLLSTDQIIPVGSNILADPERWLNMPFPLSRYCENGGTLDAGRWLVLLYNPQCAVCHDALAKTKQFAQNKQLSFAVVIVNQSTTASETPDAEYVGALSDDYKWSAAAPYAFEVEDGAVTRLYKRPSELPQVQERDRP